MIFKPKIQSILTHIPLLLLALICTLTLNTLQTHASGVNQSELNAFLGTTSSADSTSQNQQGGNKTIKYGVHPTKTGYMAYLLTADGQRASSKAVAFSSPGFSYYPGNVTWKTQSRLGGYSVSSFEGGPAPWNLAPWKDDGKTSNEPEIKEWMLTKNGGVENVAIFIKDHFGMDAALKYGEKEYILVIETLMHLQFSYPGDSSAGGEEAKEALLTDLRTKSRNLRLAASHIGKGSASNDVRIGLKFLEQYNFSSTASKIKKISDEETQRELISETLLFIEQKLLARITEVEGMSASEFASQSAGRIQIEPMLVGTVPNLVKIKSNLNPEPTVFDSYLNRTAAVSEYIKPGDAGEQAGFIAWDGIYSAGNNKIKNADVIKYGLAMMVFTAQTDTQTTCDEPQQPSPHKAPVESTGTTTIIKNYRTKQSNNTLKDDGCFVTQNVSSDITIESEGKYQVVGWKTSSSTSTIPSTTWPVPSALRSGTTSSTIKLDSTEKCLYVLLEKIKDIAAEEEEPQDYNYKLTESSITRRVHFSNPDNPLSNMNNPYIYNHTFQWNALAHKTECSGHTFTDACHGQHVGPHTASCPTACSSTCTEEHTHSDGCSDPHYYDCGKRCETQTAYCSDWKWTDTKLRLSINNSQQSNYPDILATKAGWNNETLKGNISKHYYKNDNSFDRTSTSEQSFTDSNWDYVAVLLRGKDKLTVAHWQNAGSTGNGLSNSANTDLANVLENKITEHHKMSCYSLSLNNSIQSNNYSI